MKQLEKYRVIAPRVRVTPKKYVESRFAKLCVGGEFLAYLETGELFPARR
jgi:hypothetical protein